MKEIKINSRGPLVSFLQLTLKSLNLYNDNIDGIFGNNTQKSVIAFQTQNNLESTGVVNSLTWEALLPYMTVPTTIPYTYDILMLNINSILYKFPFIISGIIGNSTLNKEIPFLKIGNGPKRLLYVAGTHANEWICSVLLMKFIENYCISYSKGEKIAGQFSNDIFNTATIYIVPMHNPDGIDLVLKNINTKSPEYLNVLKISNNFPTIPFPDGWKANILGIDLNLQFPAKWDQAKEIKFSQGYTTYAPRDFVGNYPLEAVEALALYDFTINNTFHIMLTFHSQGEVIYWKFLDYNPPNALQIGEEFARLSGYSLEDTPYASSFAGFKDWFIQTYNLPSYTIEVGLGTNPLPISQFETIYNDNIQILTSAPFLI